MLRFIGKIAWQLLLAVLTFVVCMFLEKGAIKMYRVFKPLT